MIFIYWFLSNDHIVDVKVFKYEELIFYILRKGTFYLNLKYY